ncbi:MAG TPA: 5'-methylthioadenosine/S-adenosylhomocysteine nucleosidase [Candidatus Angelobacter sp.]|nr:5'-methylthioadenosine/S-adenosylhomocysteine nucleosidase [Candidatus Angelobacter sp.]
MLTALPLEFDAVRQHLDNCSPVRHCSGTLYDEGTFAVGKINIPILLCQTGAGNTNAAIETERAVSFFHPTHVFFVGVAGGLKDVNIGDVIAATKVYSYESGKAENDFRTRPELGHSSYEMIQHARRISRDGSWVNRIAGLGQSGVKSFVGAIAAGEKVVVSMNSPAHKLIKSSYGDSLAVEMEGYGTLAAVHASKALESLVVRGISDLIEGKAEADETGSQERAAANAAAFAFEVASSIHKLQTPTLNEDQFWSQLEDISIQLYPKGPDESAIWLRAGGDVSLLSFSSSPRGAWHNALRSLRLGGGGQITTKSLLETMKVEFGANEKLDSLLANV